MNRIWDYGNEALFIELVRQHPLLWNSADKNYSKKSLRKFLYTQIAAELKKRRPDKAHFFTAGSLRNKFNTLKTYFTREQKKMKICDKISTVRKWIHFDRMLFLNEECGRNKSECDQNISIVRVEGATANDNETVHNVDVTKTNCCDSNIGENSSLLLLPILQTNEEAVKLPLKREIQDNLSLVCNSVVTETPANSIIVETNCSDFNDGKDSAMLQLNEKAVEPSVKIEVPDNSSSMCVSFDTETPVNAAPETSSSDTNERTDSFLSPQPSVSSNEKANERPSKKKKLPPLQPKIFPFKRRKLDYSSLMCDSNNIETPIILNTQPASVQLPPVFNIGSGYLVVRHINQISEIADKPTKELQLNKEVTEHSLKRKKENFSSPMNDSLDTETPVIAVIAETSCSDSNEVTDSGLSLQPFEESNKEATEFLLKRKKLSNSSPMCDSTETETAASTASSQVAPAFHVSFGNLVTASLNQMPKEKAVAATKEIFDILLKYGRETNHLK